MENDRGVFGGGNSLFRRSAFEAVDGFDVTSDFGEDMILANRLRSAGFSVAYCADPLIHDTMYSLSEIRRKQLWGAAAIATSGWELMEQSRNALLREQVLLGFRAMARGLLARDPAWLAFPVLFATKAAAYGEVFLRRRWRARR
jgi:cellulose synthase/poly-beta-1,6-N-acetylglucosamine synthase-like glycosyltransferase